MRGDAQRRRTRKAIVDAAVDLLSRGQTPSMSDIARAADVSRRTIYMYFPTLEQLLIDATAQILSIDAVDQVLDRASPSDVRSRVEALLHEVLRINEETLPLGRRFIALTVESPPAPDAPPSFRRGRRRVEWIDRALRPLAKRVTKEQYERLVSALVLVVGWESLVMLHDIRGLTPEAQKRVVVWAATSMVEAMLKETRKPRRRKRGK